MLDQLGVTYTTSQQESVKDSKNNQYFPVGQVTLRWQKKEQAKSYSETFSVVTSQAPLVILGAPAFPNTNQPSGSNLDTLGVKKQTPDQQVAMDQKKLLVAQKREQERKEQEAKEAERRRQAAPKT
ncbi:MAG: hypothetical protein Q9169_005957 [Polycauliona sp. 2 TL-2023]